MNLKPRNVIRFFLVCISCCLFSNASYAQELQLMHDKGGSPNFQPFYEEVAEAAKSAVGVKFTPFPLPTTDVYQATLKASLPSKKAPGLFTYWSTYRIEPLIKKGMVEDLTHLWDKYKSDYPAGIRTAFTTDGKAYGFPVMVDYWAVYYNKAIFKKYQLSPPNTWQELMHIADTLKDNSITPFGSTVQGGWTTFIWFEEMIIGQDPQLYNDLVIGKAKYSDKRVKKAFLAWKKLIDGGYMSNPATDLFADMPRLFNTDKMGMILAGTWYPGAVLNPAGVPDENIGYFILPSHNPAAGKNVIFEAGPIFVSKNSSSKKDALKVADWWMSPEGNRVFAKAVNTYAGNPAADASYLSSAKKDLLKVIKSENYNLINRYWEATPTPICEEAVNIFAKFITDTSRLDEVLADLDKLADRYWRRHQ
jgi:multiple sugar transport system substrate-binding protein